MADEADVFRKLEQTSIGSVAHVLRVLHELGRDDGPRPARKARDPDDARDVVFDVARFLLRGYEEFLRLQERYFDVVADGARDLARPWAATGGEVARERLPMAGRVGDVARGGFYLENEQDADVVLVFRFGEFVAAHSDRRFAAGVTVGSPANDLARASDRRLAAGERRKFEVVVRLDPAMFEPWETYVGEVQVLRDGRLVGELALEVKPEP
jgi:hypothetical protein